ncbi:MAG: hypothetical protein WDW36_007450 [Sanguina aurantia]
MTGAIGNASSASAGVPQGDNPNALGSSTAPHSQLFARFKCQKPLEKGIEHPTAGNIPVPHETPASQRQHNHSEPIHADGLESTPDISHRPSILHHEDGTAFVPASVYSHADASSKECPNTDSPMIIQRRRPAPSEPPRPDNISKALILPQPEGAWTSTRPRNAAHASITSPHHAIITPDSPQPSLHQSNTTAAIPQPTRQRMIVDDSDDSDDEPVVQARGHPAVNGAGQKRKACLSSPSSTPEEQHRHPGRSLADQGEQATESAQAVAASPHELLECSNSPSRPDGPGTDSRRNGSAPTTSALTASMPEGGTKRLKHNEAGGQPVATEAGNSMWAALPLQQHGQQQQGQQQQQRQLPNMEPQQHPMVPTSTPPTGPAAVPRRLGRISSSTLSLVPMRSIPQTQKQPSQQYQQPQKYQQPLQHQQPLHQQQQQQQQQQQHSRPFSTIPPASFLPPTQHRQPASVIHNTSRQPVFEIDDGDSDDIALSDPRRRSAAAAAAPWRQSRARAAAVVIEDEESEEEEEEEEDVLVKCERISRSLRGILSTTAEQGSAQGVPLGDGGSNGNGGQAVDTSGSSCAAAAAGGISGVGGGSSGAGPGLVTHAQLVTACGERAQQLKHYQLVGINWLMQLYRQNVGGAIMADEMGLGKTAQTICFLGALQSLGEDPGPHLIVVPASLIDNWSRELETWCPNLRVVYYYGKDRDEKRELLTRWRKRVALAAHSGGRPPWGDRGMDKLRALQDSDEEAAEEEDTTFGFELSPSTSSQPAFDILLTTYTLFEREGDSYREDRQFLTRWAWSHLVMDEAHALKNRHSIRAVKMRKVAGHCKARVMLTGTPLQNDVGELANLLSFLLPDLFSEEAARLEERAAGGGEDQAAALASRMQRLLEPFILRRMKSEVASQLPIKEHKVEFVGMTAEQSAIYALAVDGLRRDAAGATAAAAAQAESKAVVRIAKAAAAAEAKAAAAVKKLSRQRGKKGAVPAVSTVVMDEEDEEVEDVDGSVAGRVRGSAAAAEKMDGESVLKRLGGASQANNIFTHLRKVSMHPLLVRSRYTDLQLEAIVRIAAAKGLFGGNCSEARVLEEMGGYSDLQLHNFAGSHPRFLSKFLLPDAAVMSSAKCVLLDTLLPRLKSEGHRLLIFSQWTSTLDVLEWFLTQRGHTYCRLDGSTAVDIRLALVDRFNDPASDLFIFLLSTRAGGQGLNLVGADTVILHDVDFNPMIDRQAEDRCHRLGQTKPVTVYRLITRGTVDESILGIANRKVELDAAILQGLVVGGGGGGGGAGGGGGGADDGEGGEAPAGRGRKKASAGEGRQIAEILAALLAGGA